MRHLVLLGATAALVAASVPASAQYYGGQSYGGYDRPPPYDHGRRRPSPDDDYDYRPRRPPPPYGYGGGYGGFTRTCITARGACPTRPLPPGTPCGCEIPGFGYKRGATG